MSPFIRMVGEEFVLNRVEELAYNQALRPDAYKVVESATRAVLKSFKDAGIVTAVAVAGDRQEKAFAALLAVYERAQDGSPVGKDHNDLLKTGWPELYDALNVFALEA